MIRNTPLSAPHSKPKRRTYDLRIEQLQNTMHEREQSHTAHVAQLKEQLHELKIRIDEDKYNAHEMAMTMINDHTEEHKSLIARIEAQHAHDMHRHKNMTPRSRSSRHTANGSVMAPHARPETPPKATRANSK